MSEPGQALVGEATSADAVGTAQASAGALLRQAREAAGVHIAALAAALKVPVAKLDALEADRVDELPDAVFARALAATVCRMLKVDPAPVLARLPQSVSPRLTPDDENINAAFREPGENSRAGFWTQLSRPMVMAVLALLLGALVLILLPTLRRDTTVASAVPAPAEAAPALPVSVAADTAAAPPAPTVAPPPSPAAETVSANAATESAPAKEAATPVSNAVADGVIVFNTRAESWVQVTDAKGKALVRKILAPAEVMPVSGTLPLSVVVGRADAVSVQVRGKPFDLAPSTKNNVARFEVK
ncbi:MAG: helix-turn-helix domain-containing protein [Burkholderiaceae bacterium]|nr:MAG: helix-turn-helix domain-containing protein [Burkholderiaceae bacterium]